MLRTHCEFCRFLGVGGVSGEGLEATYSSLCVGLAALKGAAPPEIGPNSFNGFTADTLFPNIMEPTRPKMPRRPRTWRPSRFSPYGTRINNRRLIGMDRMLNDRANNAIR